jgi:hypothetical protein
MNSVLFPILMQSLLTAQPIVFQTSDISLNECIDREAEKRASGSRSESSAIDLVWTLCHLEWRKARLNALISAPMLTSTGDLDAALKTLERKYLEKVTERVKSERNKMRS